MSTQNTVCNVMTVTVAPDCDFAAPLSIAALPGEVHLCTECGAHRFAAAHRPRRAAIDARTELRNIDKLCYGDADSVARSDWRVIGVIESFDRFCSSWDYADALYRANMRAFEERFDGADYIEGLAGLLFDAEDLDLADALISAFDALEDYPVMDDEVLSTVEDEEFWEALTTCFDLPDDVAPEAVARWLCEHTSYYRADDLSQVRIDDAVRHLPHRWRNRFAETAADSDLQDLADECHYCDKSLTFHNCLPDVIAAEAAGQLPLLPDLAISC